MKWLQRESARYALLLVVLLGTAAIAVSVAINYISDHLPPPEQLVVTTIIWALTLGFMLIAGAFAVWAIHFAAEAESLRRLGRMVDAMDYIRDGVLALDRHGRITGLNPAAIDIVGEAARGAQLTALEAPISEQQMQMLLHADSPVEIEIARTRNGDSRTLRVRSQPSNGVLILLVSDVTKLVRQREQTRRTAFLQLVGHMAKGVANDFNDLLCGIAGHAGLLTHQTDDSTDVPASINAIQDCANRGILLARQLMQLAADDSGEIAATASTARHVGNGVDLLKAGLPPNWEIECEIDPAVSPVNIPPLQLEHLVQSLGLAVADSNASKRFLAIRLSPPLDKDRSRLELAIGGALTIGTAPLANTDLTPVSKDSAASGIIISVVSALLQQDGGLLERFTDNAGNSVYQVLLPEADPTAITDESTEALVLGLAAYAANWHILVDEDIEGADACIRYLKQAGINTRHTRGIAHVLGAIESTDHLDAMVLGASLLGDDRVSLIRAISKLSPRTGIVLEQASGTDPIGLPGVIGICTPLTPDQLLHAMIEARSRIRNTVR